MNIGHIYFALCTFFFFLFVIGMMLGVSSIYTDFFLTVEWLCIPLQIGFYFTDLELSLD